MKKIVNPKELSLLEIQTYLQSIIVPRPIALVSSMDKEGHVNLSPFSFFNLFSLNPPILVFSPSRRSRDGTTKHTYENILEVPEVVINIVNHKMVHQASIASCEYPKGINEFIKSGLTEHNSTLVKPPCVFESPVSFECRVNQIVPLGIQNGSGNMVVCEILLMHIDEFVLSEEGQVDPFKLDVVARLGKNYYCRVQDENIFIVPKPNQLVGIGIDQLPDPIRLSTVLTGNELAMLANIEKLPEGFEFKSNADAHHKASFLLSKGLIQEAWQALLVN